MIVAVLDTNVLASGIVGSRIPSSVPGALIAAWRRSAFILVLSEQILSNELPRTLAKPYFHSRLSTKEVDQILQLLRRRASVIAPAVQVTGVASHPEDDLILATAASVQPSILVSGDRQLQQLGHYQDVTILSPRAFLLFLEQAGAEARSGDADIDSA